MLYSPDESEFNPQHQQEGMSTTTKVLLIVSGILGVLSLACCGGVFYFAQQVKMEQSSNPADVQAALEQILPATIPERYEPVQSVNADFLFMKMELAAYEAKDGEKSGLAFMRMGIPMAEMNDPQVQQQMQMQDPNNQNLKNSTSEEKTYDVNGQELKVTFTHGELAQSPEADPDDVGKAWYSVISVIPSDDGVIMFTASGPEEEFNQEEIDTLIESFQLQTE